MFFLLPALSFPFAALLGVVAQAGRETTCPLVNGTNAAPPKQDDNLLLCQYQTASTVDCVYKNGTLSAADSNVSFQAACPTALGAEDKCSGTPLAGNTTPESVPVDDTTFKCSYTLTFQCLYETNNQTSSKNFIPDRPELDLFCPQEA